MSTIRCNECPTTYTEVTEQGRKALKFCSNCGAKLPTPPARTQATHGQAWEAGMRYVSDDEGFVWSLFDGNKADSAISERYKLSPSPLGPWVEPLYPFVEGEG